MNYAGQELMHSRAQASEVLLRRGGVAHLDPSRDGRVLVGGLGLGLTLRSVMESTGPSVSVDVAELVPEVVAWNRTYLRELNAGALDQPNVKVMVGDAVALIMSSQPGRYDAILLDLDNGPMAMVAEGNSRLYEKAGLQAVRRSLRPGGRAVFWSARPDDIFRTRLSQAKFKITEVPAKVHENAKRAAYRLYVAERP